MKIRTRLTIYFTALVMAIITIGSMITYVAISGYHQQEFKKHIYTKSLTTTKLFLKVLQVDSAFLKTIDKAQYDLLENENITIYDSANREIYTNNDTVDFKVYPALFDKIRKQKEFWYTEGPYKIVGIYNAEKFKNYLVIGGAIDKEGESLLRTVRLVLLSILLVSALLVSIAGWFFVGKSLEPISSIINQVSTLSPVENSERLPVLSEKDEIAALVMTFNDLFDKLEDSFRMQKNFIANVSHEINNPLTRIKSQIEVSLIQKRDHESYQHTMLSVLEDVNELIDLIQDLLRLSKLMAKSAIVYAPVRIDELLFDVRDGLLAANPGYQVNIEIPHVPQTEEAFIFNGNRHLISIALKNIIENACKFSVDKTAYVHLLIADNSLSVAVQDSGPGIPAADLPNIFQVFYRSPSMEVVKGYGIGLALANRIIRAHQFSIRVDSVVGVGTTFTIVLQPSVRS